MRIPDLLLIFVLETTLFAGTYRIDTVAGSSLVGDGLPAPTAPLRDAQGISFDSAGNLYVADTGDHRVRRISNDGLISTLAGTGLASFSGDGGTAATATLNLPYGITADPVGNLYIADLANNRIRRISRTGTITSLEISLSSPRNVIFDTKGNLYVSEFTAHRVRRILPDGSSTIVAGNGAPGVLSYPAGLALDSAGNLYIADSGNHRIQKLSGTLLTTVLGTGLAGNNSAAQLNTPTGVAIDPAGNLYVADSGNARIRKLTPTGFISTINVACRDIAIDPAGNLLTASGQHVYKVLPSGAAFLVAGDGSYSFRGDGGPANSARLNNPSGLAIDTNGTLYIADTGNARIRAVSPEQTITTVAGPVGLIGPAGISLDPSLSLYIADPGANAVRRLDNRSLTPLAGTPLPGYTGEGLPAVFSQLSQPNGIAALPGGAFYLSDTANHRVRRVNSFGILATVAGDGSAFFLSSPTALAQNSSTGDLYIADTGNSRIRKLSPTGLLETVVDKLNQPRGLALDRAGNLWIADTRNHRILLLPPSGPLQTIAGSGTAGFSGDGGSALQAQLSSPTAIAVDDVTGIVYIADSGNSRIRALTPPPAEFTESPAAALTVLNAATLQPGPVAPCSLVSIFNFPPNAQLFFDGAAVILTGANAQIPCEATNVTVAEFKLSGTVVASATLPLARNAPGLFTYAAGAGPAAALNENGTLNSSLTPAPVGSTVSLFATGLAPGDGAAATIDGVPAPLLFAGPAPGLLAVWQLNIQVPRNLSGTLPVTLQIGGVRSQPGVTLAVQ